MAGQGAGPGAMGAILAAVISSFAGMIINVVRVLVNPQENVTINLPLALIQQLRDAGIPLEFFVGVGGTVVFYSLCCGVWVFVSAILGAIGGALYPSFMRE